MWVLDFKLLDTFLNIKNFINLDKLQWKQKNATAPWIQWAENTHFPYTRSHLKNLIKKSSLQLSV